MSENSLGLCKTRTQHHKVRIRQRMQKGRHFVFVSNFAHKNLRLDSLLSYLAVSLFPEVSTFRNWMKVKKVELAVCSILSFLNEIHLSLIPAPFFSPRRRYSNKIYVLPSRSPKPFILIMVRT